MGQGSAMYGAPSAQVIYWMGVDRERVVFRYMRNGAACADDGKMDPICGGQAGELYVPFLSLRIGLQREVARMSSGQEHV